MTRTRRILAVICIAVIVVTALTPAASGHLCAVLVPLGPLFGVVVSIPVPEPDVIGFSAAPAFSVRASRAPPSIA